MTQMIQRASLIHVRFEGRSWQFETGLLGIGPHSSDAEIKQALASQLEVPVGKLSFYVLERHENGNLTLRPEAVFG